MKTFARSRAFLFAVFWFVCALSVVNCIEKTVQDGGHGNVDQNRGNSLLNEPVITPEDDEANNEAYDVFEKLLRLLSDNLKLESILSGNEQVSGRRATLDASNEDFGDVLPWILRADSDVTGSKGRDGGRLSGSRKLTRRSLLASETKEDGARSSTRTLDKGFSEQLSNSNGKLGLETEKLVSSSLDHDGNQHPAIHPREEADSDSLGSSLGWLEEIGDANRHGSRESNSHDQRSMHLLDLFRNGHLENLGFGLPGQPIRKLVGFVLNRLALKPTSFDADQQSDVRSPRKLFEHAGSVLRNAKENTGILGIHKAVKLGPLSVNFDVGKP